MIVIIIIIIIGDSDVRGLIADSLKPPAERASLLYSSNS